MKAYRIDDIGSVDEIVLREDENPRPMPKEVRCGCARVRSITAI